MGLDERLAREAIRASILPHFRSDDASYFGGRLAP